MVRIIIFIVIFTCLSQDIIAQKFGQAKIDTLKTLDGKPKSFRLFENEIIDRDSIYIANLPMGEKIIIGKLNDIATIKNPKILSSDLLKKMIKKQKVFWGDGKLYEGYLFDFNHSELEIEEGKEVNVANYLKKVVRLKENGINAKNSYPYDSSGLVFFYKPIQDFPDPYIRIIVPGYATAFVDKKSIIEDKDTYDKKVFDEYTVLINEKSQYVLHNAKTQKVFKLNKNNFDDVKELDNGVYKIEGESKQFNVVNGKATIEVISDDDSLNIWMIIAIAELPILFLLLYLFRKRILNMLSRKLIGATNEIIEDDSLAYPNSNSANESTSNEVPSKSLKKLKGEITKAIIDTQKKTEQSIDSLKREILSKNSTEIDSLKQKNKDLESEKQQLVLDNKGLNDAIAKLTNTNNENSDKLTRLSARVQRFEKQALFIDNYNVKIHKLRSFFDIVKQIEHQLIIGINSQVNYTIKQFQSIVFAKYLNDKITNVFKDWDTILTTIESNEGLVVDKVLIHQIKNKSSSDDQLNGIEWMVVKDVLLSKINKLLILLEELRNTAKITEINTEYSSKKVESFKAEIISKMKLLFDVQIDNITLFSNFQSYPNIKSIPGKTSYKLDIEALQMGDIKEIKTYGMRFKKEVIETIVIE